MPTTPDQCVCSPTEQSTRSTGSTSSKVLAAKLESLEEHWTSPKEDHDESPIKTVKIEKRRSKRRTDDDKNGQTSSQMHTPARPLEEDDDGSVGSVSTLGSTESVFDRLYKQRKPTSIPRKPTSSASVGSGGRNFRTPVTRTLQSGGTKNRKNRLGAYSNSSVHDARSVGSHLRRTGRKTSDRKDASSVVSGLSGGSGFDGDGDHINPVFERLYRNEKRNEKLWKKPDDASVTSTPSRRSRRRDETPVNPAFERLYRGEKSTEKLWKKPDKFSVSSTPRSRNDGDHINPAFERLYRNEKHTEKLWKMPDDNSIASTPSRRGRRKDETHINPAFERMYRNEKHTEKLWKVPDDPSVASTPSRRSRSDGDHINPAFERMYRGKKGTEKLWKAPDKPSVTRTPPRSKVFDEDESSPFFERLYSERKRPEELWKQMDDSSVASTLSTSRINDDDDWHPVFAKLRKNKHRDDSSVASTPSKCSLATDEGTSGFTKLYNTRKLAEEKMVKKYNPSPTISRSSRRKEKGPVNPEFDRLFRGEKGKEKHWKEPDPPSASSTPSRRSKKVEQDTLDPVFSRLYRGEKGTEKHWKEPRTFATTPRSSNQTSTSSRKSDAVVGQTILFSDGQKEIQNEKQQRNDPKMSPEDYLSTVLDGDLDDEKQQRKDPKMSPEEYLKIVTDGDFDDENEKFRKDKMSPGEYLSIVLDSDLDVVDELRRLENYYEGCTPTVALTTGSSMNWEESPDTRRQSGQESVADMPTGTVEEEVDAEVTKLTQLEVDGQNKNDPEDDSLDYSEVEDDLSTTESNADAANTIEAVEDQRNSNKKIIGGIDDQEITPASTAHTELSTTHFTDTGDSCRSFFPENDVHVERIDRPCSPGRRRNREQIGSVTSHESGPVLSPRRLRDRSAVTIQRAYRLHRAEVELVSAMIQSWNADVKFDEEKKNTSIHREGALQQAFRVIKCWWILEGLRIEDDWITLAWENEVCLGDDIKAQVNLTCEAKSLRRTFNYWEPTKVAVLLAKVTLFKAIQREQASQRAASIEELFDNAAKLQNRRSAREAEKEHEQPAIKKNLPACQDNADQEIENTSLAVNKDIIDGSEIPSSEDIDEKIQKDSHSCPTSRLVEKHAAAIKIQSFFRLTILKSAIKKWPSTVNQLQSALETSGPFSERQLEMDSVEAARNILLGSALNEQLHGKRKMISEKEYISQQAAALAIRNIVQTYVTGLRKYREKKRATLIQAIFRGYRTRKRLELEDLSAFVIQCAWSERRYSMIIDRSATKIQAHFRRFCCERDYQMKRFCIMYLQAGWRRAMARKKFAVLKSSAVMVQSVWRGNQDRKRYLKLISAIKSLQNRCKLQRTINVYKNESQKASVIQSWWRMRSPRLFFIRSVKAATCLQAHVRSYLKCREFHKARFDSIMIQRTWRVYHLTKRYKRQKRAALCLQAFGRALLSTNTAKRRRRGVLDIQRVARGFLCRQKMSISIEEARKAFAIRKANGAILVQKFWRGSVERKRYYLLMRSVIRLQKVFRGAMTQALYKRKIAAARTIQSFFRTAIDKARAHKAKLAAIQIQRVLRATLASKRVTSLRLEKSIISAIVIQSQWRGAMARDNFVLARISAVMIQASVRRMLTSRHTKKLKEQNLSERASILIQSCWRRVKACEEFEKARVSAIIIQASMRRRIGSKYADELRHDRLAKNSTTIQTYWRGAIARENFTIARGSAIIIQACARRMIALQLKEALYNDKVATQSAVVIQAFLRGVIERDAFTTARRSAIIIQAFVRMILARRIKEATSNDKAASKSAVLIQARWRGLMARDAFKKAFASAIVIQTSARRMLAVRIKKSLGDDEVARQSAVIIQAHWRGMMARDAFAIARCSAITIQAYTRRIFAFRMKEVMRSEKLATKAAVIIQAYWRGSTSRNLFNSACTSAILIQACTRRMLALRVKEELAYGIVATKSAVLIQSKWRAVYARNSFTTAHLSAIRIQSCIRRMLALQKKKALNDDIVATESVVLIQSKWRGAIARNSFTTARSSAITIQACTRRMIVSRKKEVANYSIVATRSAILIQACARRILASKLKEVIECEKLNNESAMLIQSRWRGAMARDAFTTARRAASLIQFFIRKVLKSRKEKSMKFEEKTNESAVLIQSRWRAARARSEFDKSLSSAVIIQAALRRMACSEKVRHLRTIKRYSVVIQSNWRGAVARARYNDIRVATTIIQSSIRGILVRSRSNQMIHALILIQRTFRMHVAREIFLRSRMAAMCIQNSFRSHRLAISSAVLLQSSWRMTMARLNFHSLKASAVTIQRTARGHIARKQVRQKHIFTIKIQRRWEILQERRHQKTVELSILVQACWRSSKAREAYMQYRTAAIMIQAMIRGRLAQSKFEAYQTSALRVQRLWRLYLGRKDLNDARVSLDRATELSLLVQSHWRGALARERYMQCRVAAMIIQSLVRGARIRSQWSFVRLLSRHKKTLNESARKIQLAYIAWRMNVELWELRSLAVLLKRGVRGQLARSAVQYALEHVNASRHSAIVNSRGWLVMDNHHGVSSLGSWNRVLSGTRASAAIVIQSAVRRFLARNRIHVRFGLQFHREQAAVATAMGTRQSAAIVIQKSFFAWSEARHCSAIKIQKNIRRWMAHKFVCNMFAVLESKAKAATKIQSLQRCQSKKRLFSLQKQAVVRIQTLWRKKLGQMTFLEKKEIHNTAIMNGATIKIQAFQRCKMQKHQFYVQKRATLKIQACWRRRLAQLFVRDMVIRLAAKTNAATKIQAFQRCRQQTQRFSLHKLSILKIQSAWRKKLAQLVIDDIKARSNIALEAGAATKIQALQRCRKQKRKFSVRKQATLKIQTLWRKRMANLIVGEIKLGKNLALKSKSATKIQALQRCRKQKWRFSVQRQAILTIQTAWRKRTARIVVVGMKARHQLSVKTEAAMKIQAFQRCQQQRRNYLSKKRIVITIQKLWRSVVVRDSFMAKRTAASLIQSKYRDYQFRKVLRTAIKIQSVWRRMSVRKSFTRFKTATSLIQAMYRDYQIRKVRRNELETRRQAEFDLNKLLAEIRLASETTVEDLLAKQETATDSPHLKELAARVQLTLNEAASLVDEDAHDPIPTNSLEELEARVQATLNEAASFSNDCIQKFVRRYPLAISLPPAAQPPDSPTSFRIQTTDRGTPVRSNKVFIFSDASNAQNKKFHPMTISSDASNAQNRNSHPMTLSLKVSKDQNKNSHPMTLSSDASKDQNQNFHHMTLSSEATVLATDSRPELAVAPAETPKDDFLPRTKVTANPLAKQASELLREARAAMFKHKKAKTKSTIQIPTNAKTPTKEDMPAPSPKNFGDAAMPSPIRPEEESLDWDWTSEW